MKLLRDIIRAVGCVPFTIDPGPSPYTPDAELEALVMAGLGEVPRAQITPEMRRRALAGEIVRPHEARFERRRRAAYTVGHNSRGDVHGTSGKAGKMRKRTS